MLYPSASDTLEYLPSASGAAWPRLNLTPIGLSVRMPYPLVILCSMTDKGVLLQKILSHQNERCSTDSFAKNRQERHCFSKLTLFIQQLLASFSLLKIFCNRIPFRPKEDFW